VTTEPRLGPLTPEVIADLDRGHKLMKPLVDAIEAVARESYLDHGDAGEPVFAIGIVDTLADQGIAVSTELLWGLVAHFAIREAKRAVSDAD